MRVSSDRCVFNYIDQTVSQFILFLLWLKRRGIVKMEASYFIGQVLIAVYERSHSWIKTNIWLYIKKRAELKYK